VAMSCHSDSQAGRPRRMKWSVRLIVFGLANTGSMICFRWLCLELYLATLKTSAVAPTIGELRRQLITARAHSELFILLGVSVGRLFENLLYLRVDRLVGLCLAERRVGHDFRAVQSDQANRHQAGLGAQRQNVGEQVSERLLMTSAKPRDRRRRSGSGRSARPHQAHTTPDDPRPASRTSSGAATALGHDHTRGNSAAPPTSKAPGAPPSPKPTGRQTQFGLRGVARTRRGPPDVPSGLAKPDVHQGAVTWWSGFWP
jgi:hypothetical protein